MRPYRQLTLILALTLIAISDAHAYIDPGTGSAIIQGLIASIALIGVTVRAYWFRIRAFFSPTRKRAETADEETTHAEDV